MRQRKCKVCQTPYTPWSPLQTCCGMKCALKKAQDDSERERKLLAREARKAQRAAREKLKTRRDWAREAQAAFNTYIRERDHDQPCISCGRHHHGQWHAGHYRSVGACPELRFEPLNVHKQCAPCNNHKSGNAIEYRINLVQRIGEAAVQWLEGPHAPKKYTIDELKEIKRHYARAARELQKKRESTYVQGA